MTDALPRIATRNDGDILPCPDERAYFELPDRFTDDEVALVRRGFIPGGTDDRWFIFVEDDQLYCHRSWTGACVFGACIEPVGDGARLTGCWVSRDTDDHSSDDIDADRETLRSLVRDHLIDGERADRIPVGLTAAQWRAMRG